PRRGRTGILLLPRHQESVPYRVRTEPTVHDEVGVWQSARVVLDPEGLDALLDVVVGEVLLGVGEAGPGLVLDQQVAIGQRGPQQDAGGVADDRGDLPGLVEGRRELVYPLVVVERVHRRLAADEQHRVVVRDRHLGQRYGRLDEAG